MAVPPRSALTLLSRCQANYQFSRYIAEAANTVSNLVTVALAVYGAAQSVSENLPPRYLAGYAVRHPSSLAQRMVAGQAHARVRQFILRVHRASRSSG